MKVIVFGGDGFCGWPTSLHLSAVGHEVFIVDNLSRRNIDNELEVQSLTPIQPMGVRLAAWKEVTGKTLHFKNLNIAQDYDQLLALLRDFQPDAVIHFAEQRSAPYSMIDSAHKRYTINNNDNATNNILAAIVDSGLDIHFIHLGTTGVYGYGSAGMKIPEGYLDITTKTEDGREIEESILYPAHPGSIYHLTKTHDQLTIAYYAKNDKIRATDLHQGIVWGMMTEDTALDPRLINRFDYDGVYGTVLNRFLIQSALGYPLTVHGTGGQTRAFINIQNTVQCLEIALNNPPKSGDRVKVFNQMTETHRVRDLAEMVCQLTGATSEFIPDPRNEDFENDLYMKNDNFLAAGLKPILLQDELLLSVKEIAQKYADRVDKNQIPARALWNDSVQASKKDNL